MRYEGVKLINEPTKTNKFLLSHIYEEEAATKPQRFKERKLITEEFLISHQHKICNVMCGFA